MLRDVHTVRSPGHPDYVAGGKVLRYRVRWTPTSEDSYLAHSEVQIDGKWITQFRLQLKKQ